MQIKYSGNCKVTTYLGTPNRDTIKKIQTAFITCLEILNLCNMSQPTIRDQIQHRSQNQRRKFRNRQTLKPKGSKWLSEAAKWNNATDYVDWVLSRPGHLLLNRDIWPSRRQRSGFRDKVSQTGTVPEKPGTVGQLGVTGQPYTTASWPTAPVFPGQSRFGTLCPGILNIVFGTRKCPGLAPNIPARTEQNRTQST